MKNEFPQFRKYPNNKSFFKVFSEQEFEEIQVLGSHYFINRVKARILPDRNFIADMIKAESNWVKIKAEEYFSISEKASLNSKS